MLRGLFERVGIRIYLTGCSESLAVDPTSEFSLSARELSSSRGICAENRRLRVSSVANFPPTNIRPRISLTVLCVILILRVSDLTNIINNLQDVT